jgi:hypothetical protein
MFVVSQWHTFFENNVNLSKFACNGVVDHLGAVYANFRVDLYFSSHFWIFILSKFFGYFLGNIGTFSFCKFDKIKPLHNLGHICTNWTNFVRNTPPLHPK